MDYNQIALTDSEKLMDYAAEFYGAAKITTGEIQKVTYTFGENGRTKPRICGKKGTLELDHPKTEQECQKTAALFYIIAKCKCKKNSEVHYIPKNKDKSISTKHSKNKISKFQKYLDGAIQKY
ncbi:MAG: hypothetical protein KJ697_02565 [Nanoarchaeota archaeon]|nr:hypothetical protein [Nanoarchaeota archaeon]MBU4124009.1 hypothetical protein [Nanoarchaeota archaeon]